VTDNLKQALLPLFRIRTLQNEASGALVNSRPLVGGCHRVGGLLHPVMSEPVGSVRARVGPWRVFVALADRGDDLLGQRFGQRGAGVAPRTARDGSERFEVEPGAEAGGEAHETLRVRRQPANAPGDELDDVVRDGLLFDTCDVPDPSSSVGIESE
jgi:hypothetical protein